MSIDSPKDSTPIATKKRLRKELLSGSMLIIEDLNENELAAMNQLLLDGDVEIISSACRPYLASKLNRTII